ncbi:MAG: hypothetical protein ACTHVE_07110 [Senegalia sp. (in: firmicutes)]|uniref:hypothetical protein n=1 Tax=Senegalia sp. (in: firmicutes) TaxID=1924098 RepID=UPI003F955688
MKKSYKIFYLFLALSLVFVFLVFTFLDITLNKQDNKNKVEIDKAKEELSKEINVSPEEEINEDTIIEYENYYTECEHVLREFEADKKKYIKMNEEKFKKNFKTNHEMKILRFDSDRIIIRISKDYLCPNHYIVGEYEGFVSIYKIDDEGKKTLFKKLDQSIEFFSDYDKNKLKKGILVDSIDDIGAIIENFIS